MNKEILIEEIQRLKKEKNAIILAHYYQNAEIQEIADYVGDSLALAQLAKDSSADILVVCGVHFMAETAKILSQNKKVLLPVEGAGCFMANTINEFTLSEYKRKNPHTLVISYVNTTARVKALSDVCVTSSNAVKIIEHYAKKGKKILYCPDQNLAKYVMQDKNIPLKLWNGYCDIHHNLGEDEYFKAKKSHPNALFIAHPECNMDILKHADYIGSTKQMIDFVRTSCAKCFIVGTEDGVLYQMKKENPDKEFYCISPTMKCRDMKLTTLEDVYYCLLKEAHEIILDSDTIAKAKKSLDEMLELSKLGGI